MSDDTDFWVEIDRLETELAEALVVIRDLQTKAETRMRTIAARDRRIARLVATLDDARRQGFLTEYEKGPAVVLSAPVRSGVDSAMMIHPQKG